MKYLDLENTQLDGRYSVQGLLGRGSYAEIYLARDSTVSAASPHSRVVIKALNVFLQDDLDRDLERTLVENFQNEAIALDRVRHPNVLSRIGHGTARDLRGTVFHYLSLEYLPGGDLAKLCRKKRLTLSEALYYLEQVCAGLAHAHANGIIHRDIKPQNLLLTEDLKTVKIADFGVARISHTDSPITRVGTNIYAPPEHSPMLAGQTGLLVSPKLTPSADVYSLAKTAYALIIGDSPRAFANNPITSLPDDVSIKNWSRKFLEIIEKATQTDSRQRHSSVNDFWNDLSILKNFDETLSSAFAHDGETTAVSIPQPHFSEAFDLKPPRVPEFKDSSELSFNDIKFPVQHREPMAEAQDLIRPQPNLDPEIAESPKFIPQNPAGKKVPRKIISKLAVGLGTFILFAGALFATQYYVRSNGYLSGIKSPFRSQTGVSTTDINLRSEPNSVVDNRVGVVSKNSRLKILNESNNWYEIEIVEHGREPLKPNDTDHGWVYGKYVKIDEN